MSVALQLAQLHEKFSEKTLKTTSQYPLIVHDEQWPSPCELGAVDEEGNTFSSMSSSSSTRSIAIPDGFQAMPPKQVGEGLSVIPSSICIDSTLRQ
jgi:hypothetical protein